MRTKFNQNSATGLNYADRHDQSSPHSFRAKTHSNHVVCGKCSAVVYEWSRVGPPLDIGRLILTASGRNGRNGRCVGVSGGNWRTEAIVWWC